MAREGSAAGCVASPLLEVSGLTVRFGGIVALDGVSFSVGHGQIVGLIGPNGAGKTTLFNCLSRLYRPAAGEVRFDGASLRELPAHRIAAVGIGRTFQNLALFHSMSVLDNVIVGAHATGRSGFIGNAFRSPGARREERRLRATALEMLALVRLEEFAHRPIAGLPFGTQKRAELARALASSPRLLLLDEPAGSLNHEELAEVSRLLRAIRDQLDLTVLLV